MSSVGLTSVQAYCFEKFNRVFEGLSFAEQLVVNDQFIRELSLGSQKSLSDGIPKMEQLLSESDPSIPDASQHAKYLLFATEADVVGWVKIFLEDIAKAMGISFTMVSDFGIKHVSPDICVLSLGGRLVGVVEIKKPQQNVLTMPTVLGKLFNQMMLVEGFYLSGPVIGILTTLEEWMFCWFPADSAHFSSDLEPYKPTSSSLTPQKLPAFARASPSPPRNTPSRTKLWSHGIEAPEDDGEDSEEFTLEDGVERILHTSPVLNTYSSYDPILQYICSAFTRMTQVKSDKRLLLGVSQSLFQLHRGESARVKLSFHLLDGINIPVKHIQSNRFPRSSTTKLLALEDLGRGASGKAWLCCTNSSSPALCVLKFGNKSESASSRLKNEKEWWDKVYPQFNKMTKVEVWGGSEALMMPHFCAIPDDERDAFKDSIHQLLIKSFHQRGFKHDDVAWRNMGYYLNKGIKTPVLFDLELVTKGEQQTGGDWVDEVMRLLFPI